MPYQVLYEDDFLLVVSKPAGLLFHPTWDPDRPNLVKEIRQALGPDQYLGTHQRLDQVTSGVVLFSRHKSANFSLHRQFAMRKVEKVYHALVSQLPQPAWEVSNHLGRDGAYTVEDDDGKLAVTSFRTLEQCSDCWLIEARPHTGRRHQIRVHLAGCGLPIVGDELYGGQPAHRTMLHALRLRLDHPISRQPLSFEAPYPADFGVAA